MFETFVTTEPRVWLTHTQSQHLASKLPQLRQPLSSWLERIPDKDEVVGSTRWNRLVAVIDLLSMHVERVCVSTYECGRACSMLVVLREP